MRTCAAQPPATLHEGVCASPDMGSASAHQRQIAAFGFATGAKPLTAVPAVRVGELCRSRPFHAPARTRTRTGSAACRSRRVRVTVPMGCTQTGAAAVRDVAVILLAGGVGSRMKADRPKQFLELAGRTVLEHSVELFCGLPSVSTVVIVVDDSFVPDIRAFSAAYAQRSGCSLQFAPPGVERQDSVRSGLNCIVTNATESKLPALLCVHDAARPLVTVDEVEHVIRDAREHGAAVLGVPSKATIKESADGEFVLRTIERKRLWEIHTPQVMTPDLLQRGFAKVEAENLAVTDDVSIVEHLGEPVKITKGEYTNIKITTPEDMDIALSILRQRGLLSEVA